VNLGDRAKRQFVRLPPGVRRSVLHRLGRYAPWEPEFDFTPPVLGPGEVTGPPDFVGIGAQKAGTTWWYQLMLSHPDVTSRPELHKERHFLDRFGEVPFEAEDVDRYHGWFPHAAGTLTGEWTPDYMTFSWAPELLKRAAPKARLLVLLRDPVERFRSGLEHQRRMGAADGADMTTDAVQRGFYHRALSGWLEYFDRDQLLILQYERCTTDPVGQLQATFRFLGLPAFTPASLMAPHRRPSATDDAGLGSDVRRRLISGYQSDVLALAAGVPDIDLTLWPNFSYLAGGETRSDASNSPT
jgi:hypothetical protein